MAADKTLKCRDCGMDFVFTAGEQEFFQQKGFSEPTRCPACRAARKQERLRQQATESADTAMSNFAMNDFGGREGRGGRGKDRDRDRDRRDRW